MHNILATSIDKWCSLVSLGWSHRGGVTPPTITSTPAASVGCTSCPASTDGLTTRTAACWSNSSHKGGPLSRLKLVSWYPGYSGNWRWDSVTHQCWESDRKWYGIRTVPSVGFQGLSPNLQLKQNCVGKIIN